MPHLVLDRLKSFFGSKPKRWVEEDEGYKSFTESQKLRTFGKEMSTTKLLQFLQPGNDPKDIKVAKDILVARGVVKAVDKQPEWKVAADIHRPRTAEEIERAKVMEEVWRKQQTPGAKPASPPPKDDPDAQYMWQKLDFSGDLYSQHIRTPCRSTSRKLSDLPAYPTVCTDVRGPAADTAEADAATEAEVEEGEPGDDTAAAAVLPPAAAAAAAAGASAAAEAAEQADHDASEDQLRPQPEVTAAGAEAAGAPYEVDSRSTPEQLRKSSKSMSSMTQQLQQLRAASKTLDQQPVQPGVAC